MKKHYIVGKLSQLPKGGRMIVEVKGRSIGIFNLNGDLVAIHNRCPHKGAELCAGQLGGLAVSHEPGNVGLEREGEILRCPWHRWEFDLRSGRSVCDPSKMFVRQYDVEIVHNDDEVLQEALVLETVPVTVDDDLIMIEM